MLIAGLLQLVATVLLQTVAVPYALRYMIWFVQEPSVQSWKGYVVSVWLFVISLGFSVFLAQFYHFGAIISLRMRSALIGSIYRKVNMGITFFKKRLEFLGSFGASICCRWTFFCSIFRYLVQWVNFVFFCSRCGSRRTRRRAKPRRR